MQWLEAEGNWSGFAYEVGEEMIKSRLWVGGTVLVCNPST